MNEPLLKYLTSIRQLEEAKYNADRLRLRLVNKSANLGHRRNIELPEKASVDKNKRKGMIVGATFGGIVFAVYFISELSAASGLFDILWAMIKGTFLGCLIVLLSLIIGILIGQIGDKKEEKRINVERKTDALAKIIKDDERVNAELKIREQLVAQANQISQLIRKIDDTLTKLYSLGIVHQKYHGLIPISMFCEYLETGMCTQLEGHEGAYLIYEQQSRLDKIIVKLDEINKNLKAIKETQYLLYQSVTQGNSLISRVLNQNDQMIQRLGRIEQNTELTEFNTRAQYIATQSLGDMMVFRELLRK